MTINDARRLKVLEEENRKLKHLVADLSLDNQILKELLGKNF
jgi:putative transposase